jgi:hypothetical protein
VCEGKHVDLWVYSAECLALLQSNRSSNLGQEQEEVWIVRVKATSTIVMRLCGRQANSQQPLHACRPDRLAQEFWTAFVTSYRG